MQLMSSINKEKIKIVYKYYENYSIKPEKPFNKQSKFNIPIIRETDRGRGRELLNNLNIFV